MKVAIIGGGLAGLACAHELEAHGISPTIYERNSFIGEAFPHVGAVLDIVMRPYGDPLAYLKNAFGIEFNPLNKVKTIIHHGLWKRMEGSI